MKPITTLAIDTSCDETSVAVVRNFTVLSNVLPTQIEFHKKYGGVMPSVAKLAHQERIDNVVIESMKKAKVNFSDIDAIAVTVGPGLAIALEVGIEKAKELAIKYNKPLITVNHMEGHLLSSFARQKELQNSNDEYQNKFQIPNLKFPNLGMLVSGNHTEIVLIKNFGEYQKIGETLDDSCGEAYDKCGRMLGLGYPAGPVISEFAKQNRKNMELGIANINNSVHAWAKNKPPRSKPQGVPSEKLVIGKEPQQAAEYLSADNKNTKAYYSLPVSMAKSNDLNFSYSGLKTAFKQLVTNVSGQNISYEDQLSGEINLSKEQIMDLCVIFEHAALSQISIKLSKAIKQYKPKEVWLGGGVVASTRLRSIVRSLCKDNNVILRVANTKKLFGDNAAMIGVAANIRMQNVELRIKNEEGKKKKEKSKLGESIFEHSPEHGIFLKDFHLVDRNPNLSL